MLYIPDCIRVTLLYFKFKHSFYPFISRVRPIWQDKDERK